VTLVKWQKRRIVEQDAYGDRRVYWTAEGILHRALLFGVEWYAHSGLGRMDILSLAFGPFLFRLERVADPR
jgi:hypothetical protein